MISKYFSGLDAGDIYQSYNNVRVRGRCWTLYLKDSGSWVQFSTLPGTIFHAHRVAGISMEKQNASKHSTGFR